MAISMKDLDPAFQGAGQKEYPFPWFQSIITSLVINFKKSTVIGIITQEETLYMLS